MDVTSPNNRHVLWHSYRDSGSYNVCIYDSSGAQSWCQTTTMNICSTVGASSSSISIDTICEGDSSILSLSSSTGSIQWQKKINFFWADETGPGSTSSTYSVSPAQTTVYRAKVMDGNCLPHFSNENKLTVFPNPGNILLSDSSFSICSGDTIIMRATNIFGLSYQWQVNTGNGWINAPNGTTYAYNSKALVPTQYRVVHSNSGCFSDTSSIITVNTDSVPLMPLTTSAITCGPGFVNYTANQPGTIHWYLDNVLDSIIYTGNNFSTFINTNTQFKLRRYSGTFIPSGYADTTIGTVLTYSNQAKGIRVVTTTPVTLESFYVYPGQTGTLKINLKNVSTNAVVATLTKPVQAGVGKVKVNWSVSLQSNTLYDIVTLTSSVQLKANSDGMSYPISSPGNPVTILGHVGFSFDTTNIFYNFYDMTFADGCRSPFATTNGTVIPAINAVIAPTGSLVFCQGDSVKLNSTPTGNYSRQWMKNGLFTGVTSLNYTVHSPGSYQLIVSNSSCIDTSSAVNVLVPCMPTFDPAEKIITDSLNSNNEVTIYYDPNSKNGIIASDFEESGKYKLVIIDPSGKVIYKNEFEFNQGENSTHVNMEKLAAGVYIFKLFNDNESFIKKVDKY